MTIETQKAGATIDIKPNDEITVDVTTSNVPIHIDQPLTEPGPDSGITIDPGKEIEIDVP